MIMKWIFGTSAVVGVATIALGILLVFSGAPTTESPDDTRKLASALVTGGDGTSEGIQVHGDWIIEVSDPDGTLVEKREFENDFIGADTIATILSREKRVGLYRMQLGSDTNVAFREPTDSLTNLTGPGAKTLSVSNGGDGSLILQAEFTADEVHTITSASTLLQLCPNEALPATYGENLDICGPLTGFSLKYFQSPREVVEGQKVNVTVLFSID